MRDGARRHGCRVTVFRPTRRYRNSRPDARTSQRHSQLQRQENVRPRVAILRAAKRSYHGASPMTRMRFNVDGVLRRRKYPVALSRR